MVAVHKRICLGVQVLSLVKHQNIYKLLPLFALVEFMFWGSMI